MENPNDYRPLCRHRLLLSLLALGGVCHWPTDCSAVQSAARSKLSQEAGNSAIESIPMKNTSSKACKRHFVKPDADMADWAAIEPYFDELDARPIETGEQLERWLLNQSELTACLNEEQTRRQVAMTCHTDDPAIEAAFLHFVEQIAPKCKPRWQKLRQRFVASPARALLPRDRYFVYDRSTASAVEVFREENVSLETEDEKLDQRYKKLCGAMTIQYDGKEQTLQQMSRYLKEPNRPVRRETWELVAGRRLQARAEIDDIYDQMIALRNRIGANAGFPSFREYQFRAYERFDYTPADCLTFHEAIEKVVVPAYRASQRNRRRKLGVDTLRPWDLSVDPAGRPPLKPFTTIDELCTGCSKIFHRLDEALGAQFDQMVAENWLDLESRKGKAPGGYLTSFEECRHPFIFMNAVGLQSDVETLLHESGHAFHYMAAKDDPLVSYRHCNLEMAEVASMGMELLTMEQLDVFYDQADAARARREQLEGILWLFPWIATIDAFQHWIYTHPNHTHAERTSVWIGLLDRFGGIEDYSGHPDAREAMWQRQMHLFACPFYYVEYGIAQIGALQLWRNARKDRQQALTRYRQALALGGSRPLPELWAAAGLKLDFSEATLAPLIEAVQGELAQLPE